MKREISIPILDEAPFPFHIKDKDHNWVYVNKSFLSFLETDSVVGKDETDFFQDWQIDIFRQQDRKAFEGEVVTHLEPVGKYKFAITSKFPIRLKSKTLIGGITILHSADPSHMADLIRNIDRMQSSR